MDTLHTDAIVETATSELAGIIYNRWSIARAQRVLMEQIWIEAMQNFNGEYGPKFTPREGGSSVFVNITQMKSMASVSRLTAVMLGAGGFPWSIQPTPHPVLSQMGIDPKEVKDIPSLDPALKEEIMQARRASDGMKNRIKDDLVESHWEERFSRGLLDFVTLGTMCFKGPIAAPPRPKKWVLAEEKASTFADRIKGFIGLKKQERKYVLQNDPEDDYRATIEWLSPFELYPDPGAYSIEECMWVVHRHVYSKAQVVELSRGKGFDVDEIETALNNHPTGNWNAEPWEGFIDIINRRSQSPYLSKRYMVLEFWGYLGSKELNRAGVTEIPDEGDNKLYLCNVWVLGNNCIKIAISGNQSQRIPYFVVPYEKVPHKIWGRGIPEKMADPQAIINASARAMVENMGMAAGPQLIYDVNRIMPGTKVDQILPWGIWPIRSVEGINTPAMQFIKIDPILNELKLIQDTFRVFVNEVTSIPDMASGMNSEHNRTMGGMSMLFGAADSYTRAIIFNIDNYLTKPMIRALYDWEMQYCPDPTIKGDMQVDASGVQGMMAKELTSQRLSELLQAVGQIPGGADYLNMPELMREVFRSLDVVNDAVILTDDQVKQARDKQQQAQVEQQSQIAQAQNLPKPKAQTTPQDAILQILEKTDPNSPLYAVMYKKLLTIMNQLDPQAEAAIDMMMEKNVLENKAFADQHELETLKQDMELADKLSPQQPNASAPQPSAPQMPNMPEMPVQQ